MLEVREKRMEKRGKGVVDGNIVALH